MSEFLISYDGHFQGHAIYFELHGIRLRVIFIPDAYSQFVASIIGRLMEFATVKQYENHLLFWKCELTEEIMKLVNEVEQIIFQLRHS